ncbi:MAG: hypothetical protein ACFB12_03040 [Leptolyngbyaceae cyanobacterium]
MSADFFDAIITLPASGDGISLKPGFQCGRGSASLRPGFDEEDSGHFPVAMRQVWGARSRGAELGHLVNRRSPGIPLRSLGSL